MAEITPSYYAWGGRDGWEAICVEFDIAVQGGSHEEVRQLLEEAVNGFVKYVNALPEGDDRNRLSNRRIPWYLHLKLWLTHRLWKFRSILMFFQEPRQRDPVGPQGGWASPVGHCGRRSGPTRMPNTEMPGMPVPTASQGHVVPGRCGVHPHPGQVGIQFQVEAGRPSLNLASFLSN